MFLRQVLLPVLAWIQQAISSLILVLLLFEVPDSAKLSVSDIFLITFLRMDSDRWSVSDTGLVTFLRTDSASDSVSDTFLVLTLLNGVFQQQV